MDSSLNHVVNAAAAAFESYGWSTDSERADLLESIAAGIEALGDGLLEVASQETSLPLARLAGERTRTCSQLRMFATLVRGGSWRGESYDAPDPDRLVGPKPELRRTKVPIGPVAVFGASNFPLAFSVAGGDTASALAAGCTVVVKAHPGHPRTSDLVAGVMRSLAAPGTFDLLHGGVDVSQALVKHPAIRGVGFTGSLRAGRALFDLAAARPRPIPVYAEMGSVNPLFVLPGAATEILTKGLAGSITLGCGQFCTKPGVIVGIEGSEWTSFCSELAGEIGQVVTGAMLTESIQASYEEGVRTRAGSTGVVTLASGQGSQPALFACTGDVFLANHGLHEEVFGPTAICVGCRDLDQMVEVAHALEGQLTATLHFGHEQQDLAQRLVPVLARIAGRVIANGFPTGVEVCASMQHGGPYPATTDERSTSVGTAAIERWVRPVCFQNTPPELLPHMLREPIR